MSEASIGAALLSSFDEAIWFSRSDGVVAGGFGAVRALFGVEPEALDAATVKAVLGPGDAGLYESLLARAISGEQVEAVVASTACGQNASVGPAEATPHPGERALEFQVRRSDDPRLREAPLVWRVRDVTSRRRDELAWAQALAGSGAGLWEWDVPAGRFRYLAPASRVIGRPEDSLPLDVAGWIDAMHPDDRDMVLARVQAHFAERVPYAVEYRLRGTDGVYRWYDVRGTATRNAQGTPIRMLGSVLDIEASRRAGEALRRSERLYRQMFDENPACMLAYDIETLAIVAVNEATLQHYGYDRGAMLRMRLPDLHPVEDRASVLACVPVSDAVDGFRRRGPIRHLRADGTTIDVDVTTHDTVINGRACRIAQMNDITERIAAERARQASEEHLRAATRLAQLGSWSRDLVTGVCVWSPELFAMFGLPTTPDGAGDAPSLALFLERVVPDDRARVLAQMDAAVRDRSRFTLRYRVLVDGKVRSIAEVGAVACDEHGQPLRIFGSSQDITAYEEAAEALRRSEERFRITALVTNDAIWDWDFARNTLEWGIGIQKLFGYSLEEIGTGLEGWARLVHPDDRERVVHSLHSCPELGIQDWREEYRFLRKDGTWAFVEDRGRMLLDEHGRGIRMIGGMTDITARKTAELDMRRMNEELEARVKARTKELEGALSELDAFSYSVSHDLRAPLRAMDGFSRIIEDEQGDRLTQEGRDYLGYIRAAARRMGQLIDDLLAFSRLGRQPLTRDEIDMTDLARRTAAEAMRDTGDREIDLVLPKLDRCVGDASMLRQVWLNLVANAVKYTRTRERARIEISSGPDPDAKVPSIAFRVRDNGVGFDARFAEKLFQVFQRLHAGEEFEGTGVGLAIVARVVHRHGGRVWATSFGDGDGNPLPGSSESCGAEFGFSIPITEPTPMPVAGSASDTQTTAGRRAT
jgi:PAS domain S-box-containing protein